MTIAYMTAVSQIVDRGRNTNSYKFALLRALAAFGKQPGSGAVTVSREWLAERFIEFYWPITLRFQIRQATVPDKDPVVMRLIRAARSELKFSPETRLKDFRKRHPDRNKKLVDTTARAAFRDVIPRFHIVAGRAVEPRLYESIVEGITLSSEVREFLKRNSKTLDLLALGAWVKFTERYTSAPRLYEKIQGLEPSRSGLKLYRQFLISRGVPHCFYCSNPCVTSPHVDHVVPWCFVAEDKVWNLVLACESCNSSKTSMTPQDRFIEKLTERNASLLQADESGLPVRVRRDLVEWRGGGLAEHVHILIDRCRADGFGVWASPTGADCRPWSRGSDPRARV